MAPDLGLVGRRYARLGAWYWEGMFQYLPNGPGICKRGGNADPWIVPFGNETKIAKSLMKGNENIKQTAGLRALIRHETCFMRAPRVGFWPSQNVPLPPQVCYQKVNASWRAFRIRWKSAASRVENGPGRGKFRLMIFLQQSTKKDSAGC